MESTSPFHLEHKILTLVGAKTAFSDNPAATSDPADVGRSQITTRPPCRTILSTVARPRPEAPPVTRATTPCEEKEYKFQTKSH